jgi:four helix bundle protein
MPRNESPTAESHKPNSSTSTNSHAQPRNAAGRFDYQRLDAFAVAKDALGRGDRLGKGLPRGYGKLADQLRRALLSAYLNVAEAASRDGADRAARFRMARGEASEAAAALEAVLLLGLARASEVEPIIGLLGRLCAMLTRLAGYGK